MTMLTDYALALLTLIWGICLLRLGRQNQRTSQMLWGSGFLATASASVFGGTFHGLRFHLSETLAVALWKTSIYSVGLASLFMLSAIFLSCTKPLWRPWALGVAALKFLVFTFWMISHSEFRCVVYDYASAMIVILLLQIYLAARHRVESAFWIAGGVLLGLAGGAIQTQKISFHDHFNPNDLFHVMQMAAFYLFYRGGKLMVPSRKQNVPGHALAT